MEMFTCEMCGWLCRQVCCRAKAVCVFMLASPVQGHIAHRYEFPVIGKHLWSPLQCLYRWPCIQHLKTLWLVLPLQRKEKSSNIFTGMTDLFLFLRQVFFFSLFLTTFKPDILKNPGVPRRCTPPHLNLFVYLWHAFLRVDVEDERSQGLHVAIVDWTPTILEVGGEELQDPGQSSFYKTAFALWGITREQ